MKDIINSVVEEYGRKGKSIESIRADINPYLTEAAFFSFHRMVPNRTLAAVISWI
jgi:hypothetical protein